MNSNVETGNTIVCEVKIKYKMYPKNKEHQSGDWCILTAEVINEIEGEPQVNPKFNTIIITGTFPSFNCLDTYKLVGKENYNEDYENYQYEVLYFGQPMELKNEKEQKVFLSYILTDNQMKSFYEAYENPFDLIKNEEIDKITEIKGIGVKTAYKIIEKYKESIDLSAIYVELDSYGLSPRMVEKLVDRYNSPQLVIEKVKENPYILISEVDGIGWNKADDMALNSGVAEESPFRIKAFIEYKLNELANEGFSYIDPVELLDMIDDALGYINRRTLKQVIQDMYNDNILWNNREIYYKDKKLTELECTELKEGLIENCKEDELDEIEVTQTTKVGLMKYYNLEHQIYEELMRILNGSNEFKYDDWEKIIQDIEKEQDWDYTLEQKEGIKESLDKQLCLITGLAGCVDRDTEFFNGVEWKKVSDYKSGDKVLQYERNGIATIVDPLQYHKYPCNIMWHMKNNSGSINQVLSDEHNVIYLNSTNKLNKIKMADVIKRHNKTIQGFNGKFITSFLYEGKGIPLTDIEIKVMIMIYADGNFTKCAKTTHCCLHFVKDRKIKRAEKLLEEAKINYKKVICDDESTKIWFYAPKREKHFKNYWYQCNKHQMNIIANEVLLWDGYKKCYTTINKKDADFIQFVFASLNKNTSIYIVPEHDNKSKLYTVRCNKTKYISLRNKKRKPTITPYKTLDGYKYCFSVPSGMLVLRRNGRIFITGNCGKTTITNAVSKILKDYYINQCALAGRAAQRMQEVTGLESSTIHKLLGVDPITKKFIHNEDFPLDADVIIVDEASMIGGRLFLDLLKAIKTGTKLFIIGDYGQMSSIGSCNVFYDILNSSTIPVVKLTEIHRQSKKSAIITKSIDIRHNKQIIEANYQGRMVLGELQDLELIAYRNRSKIDNEIMEQFKEKVVNVDSILDIQVIIPTKLGCYRTNIDIQELINPLDDNKNKVEITLMEISKDKKYFIQEGDKVINMKNDSKTIDINGRPTPICNGNIGIVREIDKKSMIVDFDGVGEIILNRKQIQNLRLGYAATVHKFQGSQVPIVIFVMTYGDGAFNLLSSELAYTGITRAIKTCVLIVETKALRYATKVTKTPKKQTFLKHFLNNEQI